MSQQEQHNKPIVWTIAGSDSGGGAGIQTDLATINDLGCFGCSVITAITAQNSIEVSLVEPVSESMLTSQLTTLAADLSPKAIKVGLLADQQQLDVIANWLTSFRKQSHANSAIPIIVDPVMVASCGDGLNLAPELDYSAFKGLINLITPNAQELFRLASERDAEFEPSQCGFYEAATAIQEQIKCHVLAKGGDAAHWQGNTASDLFVCQQVEGVSESHQYQSYWLTSKRIATVNNHGSGCTLSTAIACFMAQGYVLHDAIVMAKAYVTKGLIESVQYGLGAGPLAKTGWPDDIHLYPIVASYSGSDFNDNLSAKTNEEPSQQLATHGNVLAVNHGFVRLEQEIGVYPVVADIALLEALLKAGCTTVQLRLKMSADPKLSQTKQMEPIERQIQQAIMLGRHYNAQVFINDHWQLALKHGAFGIHLGQEDVEIADLDLIRQAGIALGLSSHSIFEILLAHQLAPSYIALGHIFPTTTKVMPSAPQGLAKLARYAALLNPVCPTVAIGGIDRDVLDAIKLTQVSSVAVVRSVTQANCPVKAYKQLLNLWQKESEVAGLAVQSNVLSEVRPKLTSLHELCYE